MDSSEGVRETLHVSVAAGQQRTRIDIFLTHQVQNATRSKVRQAIDEGRVTVNGRTIKASYMVQPGDVIDVVIPGRPRQTAQAEDIQLDIVYEDESLLVVNKPAGMVSHPAFGHYSGTLVNALLHHATTLAPGSSDLRPGIVHRLDKDTSGLLVVAKSEHAHAFLAKQFARRTIGREYHAIVWGRMRKQTGTIEASLGRSKKDRKKVSVTKGGKHAATEFTVIKEWRFLSYVRLKLRTGRTHQIRVHLAHIGHPVFGDATYGGRNEYWGGESRPRRQQAVNLLEVMRRQALHAKTLSFHHPKTNDLLQFDSDLPTDMKEVIRMLDREVFEDTPAS